MSDAITDPDFINDIMNALHGSIGLSEAHVAMAKKAHQLMAECLKIPERDQVRRQAAFDQWSAWMDEHERLVQAREARESELRQRIRAKWFDRGAS